MSIRRENMDRTIYKHNIDFSVIKTNNIPNIIYSSEELKKLFEFINNLSKGKKKYEISKSYKVLYLDKYMYEKEDDINYYYLKFVSLKYNHAREVENKDSLESKGVLKDKNDGDREYNHIIIREKNGKINAAFEYNYFGIISFSQIIIYLNDMISKYFDAIKKPQLFHLESSFEVNPDFIKELYKINKINAITLVVSKERIGTTIFGKSANRDEVLEDVEVKLKLNKKKPIPLKSIEEFYQERKEGKIKSIKIMGRNSNGKIRLDSEELKEKRIITVHEDELGQPKSSEVFHYMLKYIKGD